MLDKGLGKELEDLLKQVKDEDKNSEAYIQGLYSLMCAKEVDEDYDGAVKIARDLIDKSVTTELVDDNKLRTCYDVLARSGDFEAFMIAMEWNRPLEKKFYLPRRRVFKKHGVIDAFQAFCDDKLDLLVLNTPPRVGKSTLGMFLISFRAGLYPEQSILGSGHSTSLMNSFYREFLNFVTSDEYRFNEIFVNSQVVQQNAEYTYIDLGKEKRFHTVNFRSVDAGSTGLVEFSNFLYLDDLVKDAEQANSKDRLDKLFAQYTSTLKDRGVQRLCKDGVYRPAPQVFIGTPWSIYDVMSRIINDTENYGDLSRVKIVKIPCWDDDHNSNFEYDYGKGFSVKYYEDMQRVEDPVIFSAKYLQKPIEREGRPFEKDALLYYTELPLDDKGHVKEPDRKLAYNDVSHGGEDFMCMPIAYIYDYDIYIEDVLFIHNFGGDTFSRPLVCEKLMRHNIRNAGFEKNNGGDFYASLIRQDLNARGYRCNIQEFNAPTKKSKLDRILSVQYEIKGTPAITNGYKVHFKDPQTLPSKSEYMEYLRNIWGWSQKEGVIQKTQHDDGPDGTAGLLINMLGIRTRGSVKVYDLSEGGY